MLIAAIIGTVAALLTTRVFNKLRLPRFFFYPPLVSLALMVIYTIAIGTFVIGV
jgi:hypothetical protein